MTAPSCRRIGLISDTHSLLRPEAVAFLRGCDQIIHAGDICDPGLLDRLSALAALTAVRGNNDSGPWAEQLPHTTDVLVGKILIRVVHDIADLGALAIETDGGSVRVVVFGHSHKPTVEERNGILYVNPGSAGPRRFKLPIAVGELLVDGDSVHARIAEL
jgi:putative phosphoesterase